MYFKFLFHGLRIWFIRFFGPQAQNVWETLIYFVVNSQNDTNSKTFNYFRSCCSIHNDCYQHSNSSRSCLRWFQPVLHSSSLQLKKEAMW
jgi:hypothetical protein